MPSSLAADPDKLLGDLDDEQRTAVRAVAGPVCILAGAGSGKTRTITYRAAYAVATGAVPASGLLLVTFTARAAGEMRTRLRRLGVEGVQARTFHSAALRQLSYFWPKVIGRRLPSIVEAKGRLIGEAAAHAGLRLSGAEVRDLASEIEWAKVSEIAPDTYVSDAAAAGRQPPREAAEVAKIYAAYEAVKRRRDVFDFEDLLLATVALLEDDPRVAHQVREQYRAFVVDEYQDVNRLQQRLLACWLGGRDDLCVVGDPNQTIYSFTGADADHLLRFPSRYPNATVVRLSRTYRCSPQIVTVANAVAPPSGVRLVAAGGSGPVPRLVEYPTEPDEARGVAREIQALLASGVAASEIAVLYRIHAQSEAYEQELAAAGVPYVLRGGERFFERAEVRDALLLLRGAARAADADAPPQLEDAVAEVFAALKWRRDVPPPGAGAARERWENLAALYRLAGDLAAAQPTADLRAFVAELDDRVANAHAPSVEGVTLSTLHAAKGLEWDAVFLVGLVDGMLPISYATTDAAIEEERRLLYVGITRARRQLFLSWSLARQGGRRGRPASRFLEPLRPARPAVGATARSSSTGRRARNTVLPADVDPALFERLKNWRTEQAKELHQPAFCVFTDATLQAIAAARPGSLRELAVLPGIGAAKLSKYGEGVLEVLSASTER